MRYLTLGVLAVSVVLAAFGCGLTYTTPAKITLKRTEVNADGTNAVTEGSAVGASISTLQKNGSANFDASPPELDLQKLKGQAGSAKSSVKNLWQKAASGPILLVVCGGLLILGAGIVFYLTKDLQTALVIGGGGVAVAAVGILLESYPWLLLVAGVAGVGVLVYFIWQSKSNTTVTAAYDKVSGVLTALVKTIELNPDAKETITSQVETVAGDKAQDVKSVVTDIKTEQNL